MTAEVATVTAGKTIAISGFSVAISNLYGDENLIISAIVGMLTGTISYIEHYHELENKDLNLWYKFWAILKSIFMAIMVTFLVSSAIPSGVSLIGIDLGHKEFSISIAIASISGYFHRGIIPFFANIGKTILNRFSQKIGD